MIDMLQSQSSEALNDGTVDAVAFTQVYIDKLEKQLGTSAISWGIQSNQMIFGMDIAKNEWINEHPQLVRRFLKALEQASDYIIKHPEEAKAILKKRFNYSDEYIELVWPSNIFSLSLDQSLIVALEDEARWTISNKLTKENQIPDFMNYIYVDALKAIKPEAVNIR
jgi:ABC-type nitrate/sulfonate/bicarbonate transport system substrate-binding protein